MHAGSLCTMNNVVVVVVVQLSHDDSPPFKKGRTNDVSYVHVQRANRAWIYATLKLILTWLYQTPNFFS